MKKKKPSLVVVEWGDAWGANGWQSREGLVQETKDLQVISVGFLHNKNKKGVMLTTGYDEDGTPLSANFFPAGMIKKIRKVRY